MAEITGPFRFKGSLGNLRCYWNSAAKKWVVAGKGGANINLIYNSPVFARTRENMSEFTACGLWGKQIRMGLFDLDHLNAGYYMGGIVKLAKVIQLLDHTTEIRGHRNIESSKFKSLLTDINFNEQYPFKQIVMRRPEVISDDERMSFIVNLPQFYPIHELVWRKPYSFFRFSLAIAQLSDYMWDDRNRLFMPAHPDLDAKRVTVYGDWLIKSAETVDISLTASFADNAFPAEDVTVMVALGIEFASKLSNNSVSWAKGDGTMALIACL
jgi:hypothetical protein